MGIYDDYICRVKHSLKTQPSFAALKHNAKRIWKVNAASKLILEDVFNQFEFHIG